MGALWSDENRFRIWLRIEVLACEAMAKRGELSERDVRTIQRRASFDVGRIARIEKRVQHDVIAFLTDVAEQIGPAGRHLHRGLTSSDVLDTALAVQLTEASGLLLRGVAAVRRAAAAQARRHAFTPMVGRTHGVHAEPTTFGLKMALLYDEFGRVEQRLRAARETVRVGRLAGAVGTHAHLDPSIESYVCRKLGLRPAVLSTQVVQRDRHAEYAAALALAGSSIERWAQEIRHLARTEVREVEELFASGQKGSSAMPHKRNPIVAERLCGMARLLRGYALAAMENVPLWHERDISHSSAERVLLPDATTLLDYMLDRFAWLVRTLKVYPENMRRNIEATRGLIHSQQVLLELTRAGLARERAYAIVQRHALAAWEGPPDLQARLAADPEVRRSLTPAALARAFDLSVHFRHVRRAYRRLGLQEGIKP